MSNKFHIVGKQLFEIDYNSNEDGLAFRVEVTDIIKQSLLKVIEKVFDELSPKNSQLRLEKLEVDLGSINYPIDEYLLKQLLYTKLFDQLNFKIVNIRHNKSVGTDSIVSMAKTDEELVLFFLKEGYLPWWAFENKQKRVIVSEAVNRIFERNPKKIVSIFNEINENSNRVSRFIHHSDKKIIDYILGRAATLSNLTVETIHKEFSKDGFERYIKNFFFVYNSFLFYFFITKKEKFDSIKTLKLHFAEYTIERNLMSSHQFATIFPEWYMEHWIERYYPSYLSMFRELMTLIEMHSDSEERKNSYSIFFKSFLKNGKDSSGNDRKRKQLIQAVTRDLVLHSTVLSNYVEGFIVDEKKGNKFVEKSTKVIGYFDRIERVLLQYFQFGTIYWEDRVAGIEGIEAHLMEWHHNYSDKLKKIFDRIPLPSYPAVMIRIEKNIEGQVAEVIFKNYFNKKKAREQFDSKYYREEVVRIFFEKGTAPWMEIVSHTIPYVEEMIFSFYKNDSVYFKKIIKEYNIGNQSEFIRKIETVFSAELVKLIDSLMKEHSKEENVITKQNSVIPSDIDLIVYYLTYFEKYKKMPEEVSFSLEELAGSFIEKFPAESKMYFSSAAASDFEIVKCHFTSDSTIHKFIELIKEEISIPSSNKRKKRDQLKEMMKDKEVIDPIYISNAGLVLIHPFLQRFFMLCNLLEKRKFINDEASYKAIYLLQYIVNRNEKAEEHQMVLNKILTGTVLSDPIGGEIELSENEKSTCESLIAGVIENWPILKKTSNDNFRVSMIQREGRLSKNETGWSLKVEERGYDVLLDKLPWTISMIKLPWMDKVLKVEWR
ncbi:MAG TPA: contractile injection system tape measure protein [Cytophagaceae bacterium]|jgi:hypothetical protein|nr:contractile injection system tape measure protein [Cytophagaceae bacterium]